MEVGGHEEEKLHKYWISFSRLVHNQRREKVLLLRRKHLIICVIIVDLCERVRRTFKTKEKLNKCNRLRESRINIHWKLNSKRKNIHREGAIQSVRDFSLHALLVRFFYREHLLFFSYRFPFVRRKRMCTSSKEKEAKHFFFTFFFASRHIFNWIWNTELSTEQTKKFIRLELSHT